MSVIDLATYSFNIELNDEKFSKGMKEAEEKAEGFKSKMSGLTDFLKVSVVGGLAAVGTAIAGTIATGIKATADLDEQMSKFKASTGANAQDVEEIRKLAQDLYKTNTDSMEDIVATAAELKKSMGLTADEIKKYQQAYMDYAKTTGQANTDVVQAIDDISDAWGLTAEESAKSLDMLKKSNEEFGTDLVAVQEALKGVAPAAKALGLSFEETNGIMNLFASSGLDAGQAMTAFTYAAKQVKSPEEFRKLLADIQSIKDPTERAQKAVELFGARAGVAMANALDGTKNLQDFIVTMDSAAGTVTKASAEFDNNLNVQIELAKKQFTGLVQELGEKFMPVINEILKWVTANMPVIVGYVENAINFIGNILNPFIQIIKNIIATFSQTESSTNTSFSNIKQIITETLGSIQQFIQIFIDAIKTFWNKWGADIVAFAQKYFIALKTNIESVLNIIKGIFQFFTALLKGDWEGMGKALVSIAQNFWNLIKNTFNIAIDAIKLILTIAVNTFTTLGKNIMNGLWKGIKLIWSSITSWFSDSFNNLFKWFNNLGKSFYDIGVNIFNSMWNGLKSVWDNIKSWVNDTVSWLKSKLLFWQQSQSKMSSNSSTTYTVPSYDVGTPFVPNDGLAFIHKGEMIVPAKYNPYNSNNEMKTVQPQTKETHYHFENLHIHANDPSEMFRKLNQLMIQYG
ncbi:MAG: putative phage-related minor tail protein [Caloramator sp.]|uniref:phage tail tape measure protein n=1 Tax=Caloramator sp. TaxID=1871330 RepID=UPI001DA799C4|nr:phage tail tape measure protein [Caloramator sp.]MBZ4664470.1 putative phage-related minor tail protein [Caloramator sp.]